MNGLLARGIPVDVIHSRCWDAYLAATVNAAAVAKHHGVKAFINMSQMTVSQESITETTASSQQKLHWLAEQALNWSGLPVVHVRPTVLIEGFFLIVTPDSVRQSNQIRLPFGDGKTSPVAVEDVARVIAALLANPQPHIGKIYHLTGPQSENMHFYAREYSKALGRTTFLGLQHLDNTARLEQMRARASADLGIKRIYSLPPLATWVSYHYQFRSFPKIPHALQYISSGTYYARVKIDGKIIREMLKI